MAWRWVMAEVSSTRSASRGSSYGSDTPVKPLISPARALAYRPLRSRAAHTSTGVETYTSRKSPTSAAISRALARACA